MAEDHSIPIIGVYYLYAETNIKNSMAGRAYEKPFRVPSLSFEHGMKSVFVST